MINCDLKYYCYWFLTHPLSVVFQINHVCFGICFVIGRHVIKLVAKSSMHTLYIYNPCLSFVSLLLYCKQFVDGFFSFLFTPEFSPLVPISPFPTPPLDWFYTSPNWCCRWLPWRLVMVLTVLVRYHSNHNWSSWLRMSGCGGPHASAVYTTVVCIHNLLFILFYYLFIFYLLLVYCRELHKTEHIKFKT